MSIETLSSRRGVEGRTHIAVDTKEGRRGGGRPGGCGGGGGRGGGADDAERDVRGGTPAPSRQDGEAKRRRHDGTTVTWEASH